MQRKISPTEDRTAVLQQFKDREAILRKAGDIFDFELPF